MRSQHRVGDHGDHDLIDHCRHCYYDYTIDEHYGDTDDYHGYLYTDQHHDNRNWGFAPIQANERYDLCRDHRDNWWGLPDGFLRLSCDCRFGLLPHGSGL
jgi:hypothetical protein